MAKQDQIMDGDLTIDKTDGLQSALNDLKGRLDTEEPKTSALETITASHTYIITDLQERLNIEEPKTSALQTLTASHTSKISALQTETNNNAFLLLQIQMILWQSKTRLWMMI